MNFFHRRFTQDDLIAFHLHELAPRQERSMRRALLADPALAAESAAIAATLNLFPTQHTPVVLDSAALDRQWNKLRLSLAVHPATAAAQPTGYRLLAGVGIAALVASMLVLVLDRHPALAPAEPVPGLATSPMSAISQPHALASRNPLMTPSAPYTLRRSALSLLLAPALVGSALSAQTTQVPAYEVASTSLFAPAADEAIPPAGAAVPAVQPQPVAAKPKPRVATSFSLGVAPLLTATRFTSSTAYPVQSMDPSAAVVGSIRQSFRPWLGYAVNFGYTRTTEHNISSTLSTQQGSPATLARFDIPANMYELSAGYLAEKHINRRLAGFANAGAGMVSFLPEHRGSDAASYVLNNNRSLVPPVTFRPAGVGGVGLDYRLTHHLGFRAEYRALIYKYADYGVQLPRAVTVSSEPAVSLTWNLGKGSINQ